MFVLLKKILLQICDKNQYSLILYKIEMMRLTEKAKKRLFLLFSILFLLIAHKCAGQISRVNRMLDSLNVWTIYPNVPMKFNPGNDGDTIYVSIVADSIESYSYEYKLLVAFPVNKSIKGYWVEIGFKNGEVGSFYQLHRNNNFAEFVITSENLHRLESYKFDYISFNTRYVIEPCTMVKTKDYFMKFLQQL